MDIDSTEPGETEPGTRGGEEVGYGKPPKHGRFKKGQSGNPRGRRKGSRGIKTDLHAELAAPHTIHINGKPEKGTRQQLMIRTLATRAATGDVKAAALLLPLILQVFGAEDRGSDRTHLSPQDEKLLDELLGDYAADHEVRPETGANEVGGNEDEGGRLMRLPPQDRALFFREILRRDFASFARRAWPWISGGDDIAWNWHLDAMVYQLSRVATADNLRLLVTLPPRNGKSKMITIMWVAWMLGRDPTANFVCVSYSNELSSKHARDCISIMQAPWYRELFPMTIISAKRFAATDFETTAGGGRLATSVTGTLTGRGGDIIILDDVIKPDEAASETTRKSVNNWYQSTLASRLNDKGSGAIICVMQRLHQDDLAGMLLEAGGWYELRLPAIATENCSVPLTRGRMHYRRAGEALHPARESIAVLGELKRSMGSILFAAQYQQDPVPVTGNIIDPNWFASFDLQTLSLYPGRIIQSWDTASKDNPHNDWSICVTALHRGKNLYILDVTRKRLQLPELSKTAVALARQHSVDVLLIEDQASGTQLIQILRADEPLGVPSPIARRPETDKLSRAMGAAAMV